MCFKITFLDGIYFNNDRKVKFIEFILIITTLLATAVKIEGYSVFYLIVFIILALTETILLGKNNFKTNTLANKGIIFLMSVLFSAILIDTLLRISKTLAPGNQLTTLIIVASIFYVLLIALVYTVLIRDKPAK